MRPEPRGRALSLLIRWGPVVLWMAAIFWASSIPSIPRLPEDILDTMAKKLAHFVEYAVLGAVLYRARASPRADRPLVGIALSAGIGGLYGLSDEVHQAVVPGRNASPLDVSIDTLGALVGAMAMRRWWPKVQREVKGSRTRS